MDPSQGQGMPSLWVFLVIVLAVLLGVVMGTSCIMHLVQRRQRKQLARRIARGEVDLEMLGIKRLNVPQETIDQMPQYTFKSLQETATTSEVSAANKENTPRDFFQPVCSICLDDFVYNETTIRELPCKHIFHPECIDPFLRENSSLCPLCKRSALPPGHCPITVTNIMVRRERLARRIREGRNVPTYVRYYQQSTASSGPAAISVPQRALIRDAEVVHGIAEEVPDSDLASQGRDIELGTVQTPNIVAPRVEQPPPEIARRGTIARRVWRRERIASIHVRDFNQQAEQAQNEEARRPIWRRALGLA